MSETITSPVQLVVNGQAKDLPVVTATEGNDGVVVSTLLRDTGLVVHEGYGSPDHPIDLAVEDPHHRGRVLVAVETDGAAYAAMPSSRDRDRLRGEQLRRLGWMHVRVWTTDLFRDPARDVARVHSAVQQAVSARAAAGVQPHPADDSTTESAADHAPVAPDDAPGTTDDAPGTTDDFTPEPDAGARARRARVRKRRAPDQTRDDTDAGWGEHRDELAYDRWLREQRPPHWGSD